MTPHTWLWITKRADLLKYQDRPQSIAEWRRQFKGEYQQKTMEEDDATVIQPQRATSTDTSSGADILRAIPEPISKTTQTAKTLDDLENKFRKRRQVVVTTIVIVLATALVFAEFMSAMINWPESAL